MSLHDEHQRRLDLDEAIAANEKNKAEYQRRVAEEDAERRRLVYKLRRLKSRTLTLTLTLAQAMNMSAALGNTTSDPDALKSVLGNQQSCDSCYRAHQKLTDAIREVLREMRE